MALLQRSEPWAAAAALAGMHGLRSAAELEHYVQQELVRRLGSLPCALALAVDRRGNHCVTWCSPGQGPWQLGELWSSTCTEELLQLAIPFAGQTIGLFRMAAEVAPEVQAELQALLHHYGTARGNLELSAEAKETTDQYCASLQVLEEGIVLFQEEDAEAVKARLLNLAATMLQATAGALYVLQEVGNPNSGLRLEETLGMPASMLDSWQGDGGVLWPDCLIGRGTQWCERHEDGALAMLDPASLPAMLRNLVILPLRYHGVDAGLCLLFNCETGGAADKELLLRAQSLGQLGAALLHRLRLEALTARNRSMLRELEIAEVIQKRLLPTRQPPTEEYEFAWLSIAAQNIGGDYLDFLRSDLGDIYAVIADASGHGINSALLMSSFRAAYRADAPWSEPEDLLRKLNQEVAHEVGSTGMFITATTVWLESGSRRARLAGAGHTPTLHFRANHGDILEYTGEGPPLGFLAGADFGRTELQLSTGDLLVMYTDGITEAVDRSGAMFGEDRLRELVQANATATAQALVGCIRQALQEFTGSQHHEDDVSLLVIKVR